MHSLLSRSNSTAQGPLSALNFFALLQSGRLPGISDVFALEPAVTALVKSAQTSNAYIMCIVEIVFVMLAAALWVLDLVTVLKRDGNSKPSRYALLLLGKTVARLSWTGPVSEMLTIHNLSKALPTKAVFQIGCLFTCCLVGDIQCLVDSI